MPRLATALGLSAGRIGSGLTLSDDTSLSTFTVEGQAVTDGGSMSIDFSHAGETIVDFVIVATPTHPSATVGTKTITPSPIVEGDNTLEFDVTAEDGVTVQHYSLTVRVLTSGVPEITEVEFSADVSRSLHNTHFRISRSTGLVAVVLNAGGIAQTTEIDFGSLVVANFVTGGAGKYFTFWHSGSEYYFWFNALSETDPIASGTGVEVPLVFDVAADLVSAMGGVGFSASASGTVVTVVDNAVGPQTPAVDVTIGGSFVITVTATGEDAASAVGGVTSLIVAYTENDSANTIAGLVASACNTNGWAVGAVADVATFTDSLVGPRTDASNDGSAASSITVTQQGANPS